MSVFKDIIFDIQDEIRSGELSFTEIAERYEVTVFDVEQILQEMIDNEQEFDDSMDGDAESALASAGFGTDEDYGYYGEDY